MTIWMGRSLPNWPAAMVMVVRVPSAGTPSMVWRPNDNDSVLMFCRAAPPRPRRPALAAFWSAVRELDPAAPGESDLAGVREGHLSSLFTQAGLGRTQVTTLSVRVRHASFDDWWQPFTLGVGPAGAYVASLTPDRRAELRGQCRKLLPTAAVEVTAVAWAASGRA